MNISTEVRSVAGSMPEADLNKYVERVYAILPAMVPGHYRVDAIANPDTRGLFIEVVKQYMRETPWYGHMSFNNEFTEVVKHRVF